jgi:hypothetical protein
MGVNILAGIQVDNTLLPAKADAKPTFKLPTGPDSASKVKGADVIPAQIP